MASRHTAPVKIDLDPYRVSSGEHLRLAAHPTRVDAPYADQAEYRAALKAHVKALGKLQKAHYAAERSALLIVIQAMDAGGKDGVVRHVMSGINPQGCHVVSFKPPSARELRHDFLWRAVVALPERGRIGIFNRSYYEEVLVVRVHPAMLAGEGVAKEDIGPKLWTHRYESIVDFERHLTHNDTKIVKVFLHLSKDEQRRRFLSRIDHPHKNWKLEPADIAERARWDDYQDAYEDCLRATSTKTAPWLVVPADDKKTARLIVSQAVLEALEALHPRFPEPSEKRLAELAEIREGLENEG